MKIIKTINIICHYASIYGGNFIPSILELGRSLQAKSYSVLFTFPIEAKDKNWAKHLLKCGFNVFFIDFNKRVFKKELKRINNAFNVDILYTHFISGLRIKLIYAFKKQMKLIIHIHSDFSGGSRKKLKELIKETIEYKIIRKDAIYVYVSEKLYSASKNKSASCYLPNSLCLNRIPCDRFNLDEFKRNNHINEANTIFLAFGWSPKIKGIDICIESFLKSKANEFGSKLIIVHGFNNGYKKCIDFLNKKIDITSLLESKNVVFTDPTEDVFSLFKLADIFVSSSRSEGFSYSILEALYCGLDVVSSDIDGVQWAKKYKEVSFFKSENIDELASIFNKKCQFKKNNHKNQEILSEYSLKKWIDNIINLIDNL